MQDTTLATIYQQPGQVCHDLELSIRVIRNPVAESSSDVAKMAVARDGLPLFLQVCRSGSGCSVPDPGCHPGHVRHCVHDDIVDQLMTAFYGKLDPTVL